jgi:hypothetical protein
MKIFARALLAGLCLVLFLTTSTFAQQPGPGSRRDPQVEQEIYDRLSTVDPNAVPAFKAATAYLDEGNLDAARSAFNQALALAPGFPDALRRLSYIEEQLGDLVNAELHARQAVQTNPSPENQSALARVLVANGDKNKAQEAILLAKAAVASQPDVFYNYYVLLTAGSVADDMNVLRDASRALLKLDPVDPAGRYFSGLVAANDRKFELAEHDLLLAEEFGYPKEHIDEILNSGIYIQAAFQRTLRWGAIGVGIWLGTLLLLVLAGAILSGLTLAAIQHTLTAGEIARTGNFISRLYNWVIGLTGMLFYLSIPVMALAILALVGGLLYVFISVGTTPIQFGLFIVIAGFYTLFTIGLSFFKRSRQENPGRSLKPDESPELWQVSREVAQRMDTRPVDMIYLTPGVEIAIHQSGSLFRRLSNQGHWSLTLGLGALQGITQGQLRSLLAHEYACRGEQDHAGVDFSQWVLDSIELMDDRFIAAGLARWYNPAWWLVIFFKRIILRITSGVCRLQELRADQSSVQAYGVRNFKQGLRQLIREDLAFTIKANDEVKQAAAEQRRVHNLYDLPEIQVEQSLGNQLAQILESTVSPSASHLPLRDRLAYSEKLAAGVEGEEDSRQAWELIHNAQLLQEEMTTEFEKHIIRQPAFKLYG